MALRRSPCSRLKLQLIISLVAICILLFFWPDFNIHKSTPSDRTVNTILLKYHIKPPPKIINAKVESTEEEQGCAIPLTPIWPEYFSKWNPKSSVYDCSYEKDLTALKDNKIVKLLPETNISCCLQEVVRGANDSVYNYTGCTPLFNDTEDITDREVMLVKCGNSTNFHTNIPIKPKVQEKLNYWEGISDEERPFSVFILGIDTVSRSHAYRSLPKTMKLMKELDFIDFQAYHSVAPSTLTNFMAMLMGLPRAKVRGTCAKNWETPFDKCPLIWKNFSENNYVTAYVEDGLQSFNWGGQSGFVNQPTDYYLHHLFLSLADIRGNITEKFGKNPKNYTSECTSQETVPEFLLRYSIRWLEKFANTPHFLLSWFAYPFHEDIYSLTNFDEQLTSFFKFLKSQETLLRKSVIIFVSDHGDRMSFFNSKSIESYFERGLPVFQIRLPNQMKENYPDIVEAIQSNSRKLTTPFDIHHTLLHVQSLNSNLDLVSKNFEPEGKDRCSLFVEVPLNRTCASTNIPLTNCLCNAQYDKNTKGTSKISPGFANKLLAFSVSSLNMKVLKSKYSKLCSKWSSGPDDIIYTRYISQTKPYSEILIAFTAYPGEAKFEARLKIKKSGGPFVIAKFTEVVGFSRINRFGDQSWCVPMETDEDKEMKELCICKIQRV